MATLKRICWDLGKSGRRCFYSSHLQNVFPIISHMETAAKLPPKELHLRLYDDIRQKRKQVLEACRPKDGGSSKMTARERLSLLVDKDSRVLEIGQLAGLDMPYGDVWSAGCVVCVVQVCGVTCVLSANDWTVKGGSSYPITVKKQLRAQEIALQNKLPCIYFVDSGGAFLPLQSEIYPDKEHGGRVFRNEAILSSLGIPQVAVVTGLCTAGGAYVPSMCDEAVMVDGISSLFLGGPPLVRAATGEVLSAEELGGANVHCSISGCTDHFAKDEHDAIATTRAIVGALNLNSDLSLAGRIPAVEPLLTSTDEDFASFIPEDVDQSWPMLQVIASLVDGSRLQLFKQKFGTNLVTGFARVDGYLVGILGNQGDLDEEAALKGAHFVRLCTMRDTPLVFLVNTPSDKDFLAPHGTSGLVAKAQAQMMSVVATSPVPKLTIVLGGSYGPSAYAMGGRCMDTNFMFCWPHARQAIASYAHRAQAASHAHFKQNPVPTVSNEELVKDELMYPSSALYHDGIILPSETRQVLSHCLAITTRYCGHTHSSRPLAVLRM